MIESILQDWREEEEKETKKPDCRADSWAASARKGEDGRGVKD